MFFFSELLIKMVNVLQITYKVKIKTMSLEMYNRVTFFSIPLRFISVLDFPESNNFLICHNALHFLYVSVRKCI